MGGPDSSRKWALKRNRIFIAHASDLLKLRDKHGEQLPEDSEAAATFALQAPSLLEGRQIAAIQRAWLAFAREGKLRGIRQPRPFKPKP